MVHSLDSPPSGEDRTILERAPILRDLLSCDRTPKLRRPDWRRSACACGPFRIMRVVCQIYIELAMARGAGQVQEDKVACEIPLQPTFKEWIVLLTLSMAYG